MTESSTPQNPPTPPTNTTTNSNVAKPWYLKKRYWALGMIGFFFIIGLSGGGESEPEPVPSSIAIDESAEESPEPADPIPTVEPTEPPAPELTGSQMNALEKAIDYLDYSGFSRKGLINQLEYEGFSKADAEFAVDYIKPDWNEQAVRKAQDYLDYSSFSRKSLISQLKYEGFTSEQANYGADKMVEAGLL